MERQPTHAIPTQAIHFANGRQAYAVFPRHDTSLQTVLTTLALTPPQALILLAGGAGKMEQGAYPSLQRLFADGLAHVAAQLHALIIDGGTQAGVMALMGEGVAAQTHKPTLLGVSPEGKVTYPGKPVDELPEDSGPLDPNHPLFVLVETDEWGGETAMMYALAEAIAQQCPSVALLVNGGAIAKNEVLYNVRQRRPIIVIEGSGRLADEVAQLWHIMPASVDDPLMAEILTQGEVHLFPLTGTAQELEQLVRHLLQRQR